MILSSVLLLVLLCFTGVGAQTKNATLIAQEIAKIPACGFTCLEETIPEVECSPTNLTCQCSSKNLVSITGDCVLANCTLAESLELSKAQAIICDRPNESRNEDFKLVIIIGATISYTSVLLRFVARFYFAQTCGLDDWLALAALVSHASVTVFGSLLQQNGFGNHVWTIDISTVQQLLYWLFMVEISYMLNLAMIKLSILFFYLRVFLARSFRIQCWALIAFCIMSVIAFILSVVFQCRPISKAWNRDLKGDCVDYRTVAWANGGVNILQDILIVLLPVYELRILQLSLKKKIGVYLMFSLGIIVCILSIIRLWNLQTFGITSDPTWDNMPTTIWSGLETSVAITCANLPPIRGGFMRLFQRSRQTSVGNLDIPAEEISMGRFPSKSRSRFWSEQEGSHKTILDRRNEEVHAFRDGKSGTTINLESIRVPEYDSKSDLAESVLTPGSDTSHKWPLKS